MSFVTKWSGKEKLVIAIDCGTTQTGVAYAHLLPQGFPTIKRVTEWPGQEDHQGEAKFPTMIWYDAHGRPQAFGAQARHVDPDEAEENGWQLAQNFKLHLHPNTMTAHRPISLDPLPQGVTIEKIYVDFFTYVYQHTQKFFQEREYQGRSNWKRLKGENGTEFVIAHPNGWTPAEQRFLREVTIKSGFVSREDTSTVHLLTEAEASVHFMMLHGGLENSLKPGSNFIVCDAGGSTVDTTFYSVAKTKPRLQLKEIRASACIQAGGIFVNKNAENFLTAEFLRAGHDISDARIATEEFEKEKKRFSNDHEGLKLRVGNGRMNTPSINLKRGYLELRGDQVARFFTGVVQDITTSVIGQMQGHRAQTVTLVGGFGDSQYLRRELRKCLHQSVELTLANESTAKAVADGAAAWYIRRSVTSRATRFAYGITIRMPYDQFDERHRGRTVHKDCDGDTVYGVWGKIVAKDRTFAFDHLERRNYSSVHMTPNPSLGFYTTDLYAYTGSGDAPYYVKDDRDNVMDGFTPVCTITADLSTLSGYLEKHSGSRDDYWALEFEVGILFGSTELAAMLIWKGLNGEECRSKATLIPKQFV